MRPLLIAAALAISASAFAQTPPETVALTFNGGDGKPKGTGQLTAAPKGVLLRLSLTGLTPGWHAIHFHSVADCSDPKLQKSGAHVMPMGVKTPHGLLNPAGPDAGDLPNVWAADDGTVHAEVFSPFVSLKGGGSTTALEDADGSALIVHASPDDGLTQPIGGAGDRVACAMIPKG